MTPVKFKHSNIVYGEDKPEYNPLIAHKSEDGDVTTCWSITDEELKTINKTKRIFFVVKTFNNPIQPMFATTDIHEAICLQMCESCEVETDIETMNLDGDSNWFCKKCWKKLGPVMKAEYDELKANGEID